MAATDLYHIYVDFNHFHVSDAIHLRILIKVSKYTIHGSEMHLHQFKHDITN